ncbi:hypothetical protein BVX94_03490 [bacterium B17]|nr:hypothetical protein BVX94_03490 [bacterium B17]
MKHMSRIAIILLLTAITAHADLDILVVGSSSSYSDAKNPGGMKKEKAFKVSDIADQLREIFGKDRMLREKVNVVYEDVHRDAVVHTDVAGWKKPGFRCNETTYECYSLAQYYMWPKEKKKRLANLRGEGGTEWDYVVITGDPYIMANFPGIYAVGAGLVAEEVKKGTAKPILLAQWPDKDSSVTADDLNEIVYRVGNSGGYNVVPAGKAWDTMSAKDSSPDHPTKKGALLAAACVYTEIRQRKAGSSRTAYHAFNAIKKNKRVVQYKGLYTKPNAFQMKYDSSRHVDLNHTGTSTESGFLGEIQSAMNRCKVTHKRYAQPDKWPKEVKQVNFNYGRANAMFEPKKKFDPPNCNQGKKLYRRSYGFPMQDHAWSANKSMEYGIDWRRLKNDKMNQYDDGTDLGIAVKIQKDDLVKYDVRAIPVRLLVALCRHTKPELKIQFDTWHFAAWADEAVGTFLYTLQSGRCPMSDEPENKDTGDWNKWLGRKIGYETAWQAANLTSRAPGFQVKPGKTDPSITANGTDAISIRFMLPPTEDVSVGVYVDKAGIVDVSKKLLTFTPENYNTVQTITVTGKSGQPGKTSQLRFETRSKDTVYDRLHDSWAYQLK